MADETQYDEKIQKFFEDLLEAHQLPVVTHEEWTTIGGRLPAFRGAYLPPKEDRRTGLLSTQIALPGQKLVTEPIAAVGPTPEGAVDDALTQFAIAVFHPVIAACHDVAPPELISAVDSEDQDGPIRAYFGHPASRHSTATAPEEPAGWIDAVIEGLSASTLEAGLNWVSIYAARVGSEAPQMAINLNNVRWIEGENALSKIEWPHVEGGFISIRAFVTIAKAAEPEGDE